MKFIHISDTHFGSFSSYQKIHLKEIEEFKKILNSDIDFLIVSGDIFNTPFQIFEGLDSLISAMRNFIESGKKIYAVPGSHDVSSGGSLFSILDSAGIITNVYRYKEENGIIHLEGTYDKKTGTTIYGVGGETNSREIDLYDKIDVKPEEKSIFIFHSPIKGSIGVQEVRELDLEKLPKGFSYYAGGHVHKRIWKIFNGSYIVYPGPFFGSSFDELYNNVERGYALVEDFKPRFFNIEPMNIYRSNINCDGKSSRTVIDEISIELENVNAEIIFINLFGKAMFNPDDVNLGKLPMRLKRKSIIMLRKKNLNFENEAMPANLSMDDEIKNIQSPFSFDIMDFVEKLKSEREEGERIDDFKKRLIASLKNELEMVEKNDNQVH
ncbi:MAG: metallophosphoesterase family protein [Thermoplasmata archaeon]